MGLRARDPRSAKVLVTVVTGRHYQDLHEITNPWFDRFADRHGYERLIIDQDCGEQVAADNWLKVRGLLDALDTGADYALVTDVDMILTDACPDPATLLEQAGAWQALAYEAAQHGFTTSLWAVASTSRTRQFLEMLWCDRGTRYGQCGYEGAAARRLLNDPPGYLDVHPAEWWHGTMVLPGRWCHRVPDPAGVPSDAYALHVPYPRGVNDGDAQRLADLRHACDLASWARRQ